MFVDRYAWPPPPPPPEPPAQPKLSGRDETVLAWLIGLMLLAWFLAPIAGVTIFEVLASGAR